MAETQRINLVKYKRLPEQIRPILGYINKIIRDVGANVKRMVQDR